MSEMDPPPHSLRRIGRRTALGSEGAHDRPEAVVLDPSVGSSLKVEGASACAVPAQAGGR